MTDISNLEEAIYQVEGTLTMQEALEILNSNGIQISKWKLARWAKRLEFGHKIGGRWAIDPDKLALWVKGKLKQPAIINPSDKRRKWK